MPICMWTPKGLELMSSICNSTVCRILRPMSGTNYMVVFLTHLLLSVLYQPTYLPSIFPSIYLFLDQSADGCDERCASASRWRWRGGKCDTYMGSQVQMAPNCLAAFHKGMEDRIFRDHLHSTTCWWASSSSQQCAAMALNFICIPPDNCKWQKFIKLTTKIEKDLV